MEEEFELTGEDRNKEPSSKQEELINDAKGFIDFSKKNLAHYFRNENNVVFIDFQQLAEYSSTLSDEVLKNPDEVLRYIELAIEEMGLASNVRVRLYNLFESQEVRIRNIRSKHLNELIVVEGIIRQASDVRPQVVNAKFECPSCATVISVLQIEKKFREPTRCSCGRRGGFRLISKEMVDTQRLIVEEAPDMISGGEQPKRINVFVKEDLVEPRMEDKTTPGSRVKVIGVLKEVPVPLTTGGLSTRFDLAVEVNNLIPLEETFEELDITEEDEKQIQELAADPLIFEKLSQSIAPSVFGYKEIKESLVLQLFGGVQKQMMEGQKTRGDIHILMIGDPGVAKSVILGFMASISPKGRYVVGKSTSGAGLTATVVRDEYLKGWSLEAGAMVLANKGLVCIDELEKMDPQDRSAMHEAMEQQTVTISKANVQACYSQDTEVLTEEGWKDYKEVKNLKIAQYSPEKNTIKFLPHKGLYVYDYNKEMYSFKNKRNDILVTPNHKMLLKEYRHRKYQAMNAEDIPYGRIQFRNSGEFISEEEKYFILPAINHKQKRIHEKYIHQHKDKKIPQNLWLEFLGYYITEGGIETIPTIGIVQKKGKQEQKIKKCLTNLTKILGCSLSKIDCGKYTRFKITQTQLYEYLKNLGTHAYNKTLNLNFSKYSKKQLKILFDAMILGDGYLDKSFSVTSEKLADELQVIAHLIGKSASKNIHEKEGHRKNRKTTYRITISDKNEPTIKKKFVNKIAYNGKVYCFSTETGFFVTRRNGKIAIQGNTLKAQTSVLAAANPKFGRFDPTQGIPQQIDLPPALINRFDVIFTMRDVPNKAHDERVATHILDEHKTVAKQMIIEREIFRKYVAHAKQKVKPKLSEIAIKTMKDFYVGLRNRPMLEGQEMRTIPISARQLNSLIRMAEASAKLRLSEEVTEKDAEKAINLMKYYLEQAGYDEETGQIDLDKISGKIRSSQRNKIYLVRDTINELRGEIGEQIPVEKIEEKLRDRMNIDEIEEALDRLAKEGNLFRPRHGYVQKT